MTILIFKFFQFQNFHAYLTCYCYCFSLLNQINILFWHKWPSWVDVQLKPNWLPSSDTITLITRLFLTCRWCSLGSILSTGSYGRAVDAHPVSVFFLGSTVSPPCLTAGRSGSVWCTSYWRSGGRSWPLRGPATFFRGDRSWNIFFGHPLSYTDSRRAIVSFWGKNVYDYWLTSLGT